MQEEVAVEETVGAVSAATIHQREMESSQQANVPRGVSAAENLGILHLNPKRSLSFKSVSV